MRIAIDACCWSNRRGFGRYTRELVSHMVLEHPEHAYTLVVDGLTADEGGFPEGAQVEVVRTRHQPTRAAAADGARSLFDLGRMSWAASRVPADVFFFPAVYSFYPLLRRVPTVVAFHDAIPENHPHLVFPGRRARLFWRLKCRAALWQADQILTVSESARARLAEAFGRDPAQIRVVHEAPSAQFRPVRDPASAKNARRRHGLPEGLPLLLYVGGISPHKNLGGLLEAFACVRRELPCHLVLVGDYSSDSFLGCYDELLASRARLRLDEHVTFTGFVSNEDLVNLYGAASALVLPSFEEGFGLPAVEALACDLPVAASHGGSLPEVLGAAAAFFDPANTADMATALMRLLTERDLRVRLVQLGRERIASFSWSAAAREILKLLIDTARR